MAEFLNNNNLVHHFGEPNHVWFVCLDFFLYSNFVCLLFFNFPHTLRVAAYMHFLQAGFFLFYDFMLLFSSILQQSDKTGS